MDTNEDVGLEERLKSALWLSIGKIVDEETIKLGMNATPQFIGALTELVWVQIGMALVTLVGARTQNAAYAMTYSGALEIVANGRYPTETASQDLECFAKHAGRSTINVSDVMMLARRNEGLESILRAYVDRQREQEKED
ncbi:CENP-S family protein [Aspergillus mulundensis]|uniref:Apoptosis-inducing TAF9-like domain 1 family protein n=1 Tax=Aspergillus mulundensis TaxID=1810919 RepID=A0A3D8SUD6_9EURO|nr:hypothetical protein DSM5745_01566 [Aspergillus mulundensis]RDW89791.1 hypothetical protein DSM5745_01566 [Aspergillus mulundensis]